MNKNILSRKDFLKDVSWIFGSKSVKSICNAIEMILLARLLGLQIFGVLTLVIAYVKLINYFLDFRVWETAVKYVGEFAGRNEKSRVLSMIKLSYFIDIFTGFLALLVSVSLAKYGNELFVKSSFGFELIVIFSVSLLFSTANYTSEALFRVFNKFKTITFVNSAEAIFKLLSVTAVLIYGYGIYGVLICYIVTSFIGFIVRQFFVQVVLKENNYENWISSRILDISDKFREIGWFLINTSFNATLKMASEGNIAILILGYFFDSSSSGLYKVARSVIKIFARVVDPVYETIFPKLVNFSATDLKEGFRDLVVFSLRSLLKLVVPLTIIILIFAEKIIGLFFGVEYVSASNTMRILTVAVLFSSSTFWLTPSLLAIGRPGARTVINTFKVIVYLLLLIILVPRYSFFGAAVAFLVSEMINFIVAMYARSRLMTEVL